MCTVQCVNTVDNGRFWWQQAILPVLPLPSAHSILDTNFVLINSKFTSQYFIAARVSGHCLDPCLHCICYCQCCLVWRACVIHSTRICLLQVFPSGINQYELQIPGLIIAIIIIAILILLICLCCCVLCCWECRRCACSCGKKIEDGILYIYIAFYRRKFENFTGSNS